MGSLLFQVRAGRPAQLNIFATTILKGGDFSQKYYFQTATKLSTNSGALRAIASTAAVRGFPGFPPLPCSRLDNLNCSQCVNNIRLVSDPETER